MANLKDRMKQNLPEENQTFIQNPPEQTLNGTTQNPDLQSQESAMIQKLLSEKAELLSLNQDLVSQLRTATDKYDRLNEKYGILLGSDKKLKEAERLSAAAQEISDQAFKNVREANRRADAAEKRATEAEDKAIVKANREIKAVKDNLAEDLRLAKEARKKSEENEAETLRLLKDRRAEIDKAAEKRARAYEASNREWLTKQLEAHQVWHVTAFAFCVVFLIIQALASPYFRSCVADIWRIILELYGKFHTTIIGWNNAVKTGIEIQGLDSVTAFFVGILSSILLYIVPPAGIIGLCTLYFKSKLFDKFSAWIMTAAGIALIAVSAVADNPAPKGSSNLVLWWLGVQAGVPAIRYVLFPLIGLIINHYDNKTYEQKQEIWHDIQAFVIVASAAFFVFLVIRWMVRAVRGI